MSNTNLYRALRELLPEVAALRRVGDTETVPLAREGRTLLTRLQTVSERIDTLAGATGEGVATSTLPRLNGLLQELTTTSRQLSDLLDEIDNSPQLLLLGRGKPVPGPGEAGFRQPGR